MDNAGYSLELLQQVKIIKLINMEDLVENIVCETCDLKCIFRTEEYDRLFCKLLY